jgi:hypothetical protein
MFAPSIAWRKTGKSPAVRLAEGGDLKRIFWIDGSLGEKTHPVTFKLTRIGLRYTFSMLNSPKEVI